MASSEPPLGLVYGLALGDALGWPVEFQSLAKIRARYGVGGIQHPPDPALFTDDTQMTVALAEALIERGEADLEPLMQAVARRFVAWAHDPETPSRAPGNTCLRGVANLERGLTWQQAGIKESKGCGSAMRVAPIGYLYQSDEAKLRQVAHASGFATHQHPAADAASQAAAYLVKLALDGVPPADYFARVLDFCAGLSGEFDTAIQRAQACLDWPDETEAMEHIGGGWVGEEAVALALFACARHPDDYVVAMRCGANVSGDSDSVACIAGGILGARLGLAAIPADWIARLEKQPYLAGLAQRLAAKREAIYG